MTDDCAGAPPQGKMSLLLLDPVGGDGWGGVDLTISHSP